MRKTRQNYVEGTCFMVPLIGNGYATGIVARFDGRGQIYGYFFGPRRQVPPRPEELKRLSAKGAVFDGLCGDLGIIKGEWPILAALSDWDRSAWPLPPFARRSSITGECWKIFYSASLEVVQEEKCACDDIADLKEDDCYGFKAIETKLSEIVSLT